eukprot:3839549-Pyramimonas_sp.AAC.1
MSPTCRALDPTLAHWILEWVCTQDVVVLTWKTWSTASVQTRAHPEVVLVRTRPWSWRPLACRPYCTTTVAPRDQH